MTSHRLFYHLGHVRTVRAGREPRRYAIRDSEAARYITAVLQARAWGYGGLILNQGAAPLDLSIFRSHDLIFINTCFPLRDLCLAHGKPVEGSFAELEDIIFRNVFARWFGRCAGSEILLSDLAASVSPAVRARQARLVPPAR